MMTGTALTRRPQEASTWPELEQYFTTRARQLWHEGWRWSQTLEDTGVGCRTEFTSAAGERFASYYVLAQFHGQGHFKQLVKAEPLPIVTITDCHIEQILDHIGARYLRAGDLLDTAEYRLVEAVLADNRDNDGVFLMNHVDEGLAVLAGLGTSTLAKRAFCLLPLVRADADLAKYCESLDQALGPIVGGHEALALAMTCRGVACCWRPDTAFPEGGLPVGAVQAVHEVLIAENVQKRKALSRSNQGAKARLELDTHYRRWLEALGAADQYNWLSAQLPEF